MPASRKTLHRSALMRIGCWRMAAADASSSSAWQAAFQAVSLGTVMRQQHRPAYFLSNVAMLPVACQHEHSVKLVLCSVWQTYRMLREL